MNKKMDYDWSPANFFRSSTQYHMSRAWMIFWMGYDFQVMSENYLKEAQEKGAW